MTKRLSALIEHWSKLAAYYGGAGAKRYRGNLKRASTAARETADLFDRFEGPARHVVSKDIETLRKAATLLAELSDEFEVAQRQAEQAREAHIKASQAESDRKLNLKIQELFGQPADPAYVYRLAEALDTFCRSGVDDLAKAKGCERGLLAGDCRTSELPYAVQSKKLDLCTRILAENALQSCYSSRKVHDKRYNTMWYHANWDDFMSWFAAQK